MDVESFHTKQKWGGVRLGGRYLVVLKIRYSWDQFWRDREGDHSRPSGIGNSEVNLNIGYSKVKHLEVNFKWLENNIMTKIIIMVQKQTYGHYQGTHSIVARLQLQRVQPDFQTPANNYLIYEDPLIYCHVQGVKLITSTQLLWMGWFTPAWRDRQMVFSFGGEHVSFGD